MNNINKNQGLSSKSSEDSMTKMLDQELGEYKVLCKNLEAIKTSLEKRLDVQTEEIANLQLKLGTSQISLQKLQLEHQKLQQFNQDVILKHQKLQELVKENLKAVQDIPGVLSSEFTHRFNCLENTRQNLQNQSKENVKLASEIVKLINMLPKKRKRVKVHCRYCCSVFPTRRKLLVHQRTVHSVQKSTKLVQSRKQNAILIDVGGALTADEHNTEIHFEANSEKSATLPYLVSSHRHKIKTLGISQMECKKCKKRFRTQLALKLHSCAGRPMMTSDSDKPTSAIAQGTVREISGRPMSEATQTFADCTRIQNEPQIEEATMHLSTEINAENQEKFSIIFTTGSKKWSDIVKVKHMQQETSNSKNTPERATFSSANDNLKGRVELESQIPQSTPKSRINTKSKNILAPERKSGESSSFVDSILATIIPEYSNQAVATTKRKRRRVKTIAKPVTSTSTPRVSTQNIKENSVVVKPCSAPEKSTVPPENHLRCSTCPKQFTSKRELAFHSRIVHRENAKARNKTNNQPTSEAENLPDNQNTGIPIIDENETQENCTDHPEITKTRQCSIEPTKKNHREKRNLNALSQTTTAKSVCFSESITGKASKSPNKLCSRDSSMKKFKCRICSHRFFYLSQLRAHEFLTYGMESIRIQNKHGCQFCGGLFGSRKLLYEHKRNSRCRIHRKELINKRQESTTKANLTNLKEIQQKRLKIKRLLLARKNRFTSTLEKVTKAQDFDQPKASAANAVCSYSARQRKFACQICPRKFFYLAYLKYHVKNAHKKQSKRLLKKLPGRGCAACGATFSTREELAEHRRNLHSKSMQVEKPTTKTSNPVQCSNTSLPLPPFSNDVSIKEEPADGPPSEIRHGKDQAKCKPNAYFCLCGAQFYTESVLVRHCKVPKFTCKLCTKRFNFEKVFDYHMKTVHGIAGNRRVSRRSGAKSMNAYSIDVIQI